jgi:NAD(P)-dependent dehydrogenase (short-subunit alcohol dehydrogenase family)
MHLKGKKVLINSGSSGIGFAIAEAALAKGADVAITGRRHDVVMEAARQLRQGGRRVEFVRPTSALRAAARPHSSCRWKGWAGFSSTMLAVSGPVSSRIRPRPRSGR